VTTYSDPRDKCGEHTQEHLQVLPVGVGAFRPNNLRCSHVDNLH